MFRHGLREACLSLDLEKLNASHAPNPPTFLQARSNTIAFNRCVRREGAQSPNAPRWCGMTVGKCPDRGKLSSVGRRRPDRIALWMPRRRSNILAASPAKADAPLRLNVACVKSSFTLPEDARDVHPSWGCLPPCPSFSPSSCLPISCTSRPFSRAPFCATRPAWSEVPPSR